MTRQARARQPFIGIAIAAAAGIVAADFLPVSPWAGCSVVLVAAVAALVSKQTWLALLVVGAAFFQFHLLRQHESGGERLAALAGSQREVVRGIGVVVDEPRALAGDRGPSALCTLQVREITLRGTVHSLPALVSMRWEGGTPAFGDVIRFTGSIEPLERPRNPGEFDFAALRRRQGVYSEIHVRFDRDAEVTAHDQGNPMVALALRTRQWMQRKLTLDLEDEPEAAGLIQGMVLGIKSETPEEIQRLFERTGTVHIFVVSGFNVALLTLIIWSLLRTAGIDRRLACLIVIPAIWFYALITGLSPASIRATIMGTIVLAGYALDRPAINFNSFAAAFVMTLLWDTRQLFMPGFQFSFAVVFSILVLATPMQRWLRRKGDPDPFLPRLLWRAREHARHLGTRWVAELLAVSLAAWIGSLVFCLRYFHLISPSAVLANLLVVPTASLILVQGLLSLACSVFSDFLAAIFNNANWFFTRLLVGIVSFFSHLPGGYRYIELPMHRQKAVAEVTVLDLGSGGAIHVRSGSSDWLLDCGHLSTYRRIVRPYLRMRGVNRLDGLLLTHGDAGHIGAAPLALEDFDPGEIADSPLSDRSRNRRSFHATMAELGRGKTIVRRGDIIPLTEDVSLEVLYPPPGVEVQTADDKALVLRLDAGGLRVLFTADSGFLTEEWLRQHEPDLHCDILVKGRHRTDFSGSLGFIDAARPSAIVISSTTPLETGHLPENWTAEIERRGIMLFEQENTGAVQLVVEPDGIRVTPFLERQSFLIRRR